MVKTALSPLSPKKLLSLAAISGIDLYTYSAQFYNKKRDDIAIFIFPEDSSVAEVFTKSSLRSKTLDWNEKNLKYKKIRALFINAGNANTFTGEQGQVSIIKIANKISSLFSVDTKNIFVASTGVIGEPFPISKVLKVISKNATPQKNWKKSAEAIMTTDTFPKGVNKEIKVENKKIHITGISKGSGMIAPNMATMLGFIFTDIDIDSKLLNQLLKLNIEDSFNSITVDGDESTNDTVILASSRAVKFKKKINSINDSRIKNFKLTLKNIFQELSEQIVRDGEGATKLIEVQIKNSISKLEAKTIAKSIANSPLVKTAIHGSDPNWGRIIMSIGKTYYKVDERKLAIKFGDFSLVKDGKVINNIDEKKIKSYLNQKKITITIDLKKGKFSSKILTCDFSKKYIEINASYKS